MRKFIAGAVLGCVIIGGIAHAVEVTNTEFRPVPVYEITKDGGVTPGATATSPMHTEEVGPTTLTTGCITAHCNIYGDAGTITIPVNTRYVSTVSTDSPIRVANGASCVTYGAGGVGRILNEGSVLYFQAPAGTGPDGGAAKYECCASSSTATTPLWQLCPVQ